MKEEVLAEITPLLLSEFQKVRQLSQQILLETASSEEIQQMHQQFLDSLTLSALLEEALQRSRPVTDLIGLYLLAAKAEADRIKEKAARDYPSVEEEENELLTVVIPASNLPDRQLNSRLTQLTEALDVQYAEAIDLINRGMDAKKHRKETGKD
ncbi:hypothetical protein I6N95_03770 [Vagococcus sp. BWB3-3]|uniref:Uncharacterized protein n=1 Tax=Vagococcus allomyrinae TaxID=2794353 RepID=A0A940SV98_9ENTE|nr:hypothetical protein [Vagococcus allomyrinae]MBP1040123.1 hypothetical protein [Vagococcus allomyrinae]